MSYFDAAHELMEDSNKQYLLHVYRLSSVAGRNSISVGPTMNLISNDVERFMLATLFASYIIWAPLQAIAILVIGLFMIGPAFAAGVGILLFVFIPTQMILGKRFASLRSKVGNH